VVYNFTDTHVVTAIATASKEALALPEHTLSFSQILLDLLGVMQDVLPIILVIAFFQYVIIKKPIAHLPKILTGIVLVILGLDAFIVGLEIGLFPIGETIAYQLTTMKSTWVIYLFGFMIGFATTMEEPALIAIAMKASEVSNGNINQTMLRIFVAIGVAIGIALGCFRLVNGASLHYFIIIGYSIVIVMTYFAPKYIVPIAYDSGGVTTSTVTVPLVAALGLGLAQNIEGRDPLIDGFGLIAFASLFPMITVMGYGIITQRMIQRREK